MTTQTPASTPLPAIWYDYTLQCWIKNGLVQPCGHPASMRPTCCYAGAHANEPADPSHFEKD